jgi:hypothetical protein
MSDSYPTMNKAVEAYGGSDVHGYIDLSKIPEDAIMIRYFGRCLDSFSLGSTQSRKSPQRGCTGSRIHHPSDFRLYCRHCATKAFRFFVTRFVDHADIYLYTDIIWLDNRNGNATVLAQSRRRSDTSF